MNLGKFGASICEKWIVEVGLLYTDEWLAYL